MMEEYFCIREETLGYLGYNCRYKEYLFTHDEDLMVKYSLDKKEKAVSDFEKYVKNNEWNEKFTRVELVKVVVKTNVESVLFSIS